MKKLRVLDLFSGIGGFSLGLERTGGFETVAFCEMKPHARAVLAKNFPGIPCHDDVTTYQFKEGEADVITAGFPCQDLSFAGAGAGLAGARSGLYREVIRAIRVVRPLRAVLENVAALLSRGLGTVLGDLASVGYDAEWHCIPASAVGAPHRRDRIWIVADAGGEQHESRRPPLSGTLAAELSRIAADTHEQRTQISIEGNFPAIKISGGDGPYGQVADAKSERCVEAREFRLGKPEERPASRREEMANTAGSGRGQGNKNAGGCRTGEIASEEWTRSAHGSWWAVEPDVGRVAHGVPNRVDRLGELGNAVVPQIPEIIGHAILQSTEAA